MVNVSLLETNIRKGLKIRFVFAHIQVVSWLLLLTRVGWLSSVKMVRLSRLNIDYRGRKSDLTVDIRFFYICFVFDYRSFRLSQLLRLTLRFRLRSLTVTLYTHQN